MKINAQCVDTLLFLVFFFSYILCMLELNCASCVMRNFNSLPRLKSSVSIYSREIKRIVVFNILQYFILLIK